MSKVDVLAITINLCTFECIDLVGSMLMCVGDVCTCIYMHACRVHACVTPFFGLAVNIFIVLTVVSYSCLLQAALWCNIYIFSSKI